MVCDWWRALAAGRRQLPGGDDVRADGRVRLAGARRGATRHRASRRARHDDRQPSHVVRRVRPRRRRVEARQGEGRRRFDSRTLPV